MSRDDVPHVHPSRDPADDERVPMTAEERTTWSYLVAVASSTTVYLAVVVPRALDRPIAEVSWAVPLAWTIGASVLATVLGTIVAFGAGAAGALRRGFDVHAELRTDQRDREISAVGTRRGLTVTAAGLAPVLVLAMVGAEHFWIGNAAFAAGVAGALVETVTKLRVYRRGG